MRVCVYVCICICIYTCICVYTCIYTYTYTYTNIYTDPHFHQHDVHNIPLKDFSLDLGRSAAVTLLKGMHAAVLIHQGNDRVIIKSLHSAQDRIATHFVFTMGT